MSKLNSSLLALALVAGPMAGTAHAQDGTVTVDLGTIAPEIALELGIDANDVPTFVDLSFDAAIEACGLDADDFGDLTSCDAFSITADVLAAVEASTGDDDDDGIDDDGDEDDGGPASENSAREFAPGQQDGPAVQFAPGQQEGPATDYAPGQVKKADDEGDDEEDEDDDE